MTRTLRLPSYLKPVYETDLIRVGQKKDGGYLIPKKSLEFTKILFSFGLEADWSFEEDFFKRAKSTIYCYDHTVNFKFFVKLFLGNPKTVLKFFQYKKFFDKKSKFHVRKMICPTSDFAPNLTKNSLADLNSIMKPNTSKEFFLKIDIEGGEYRILDQIKNFAPSLNTLIIEFHDCDLHFEKIKNFINNFRLQLVHIHANNFSLINSDNCPRAVELTFCTKEFTKNSINENKKFPTLLDMPNNQLYPDLPIMFYND